MAAAIGLGERGVGQTGNNPSVGCIIVKQGRIIGRGWTQPGGRPHGEAMALEQAGDAAQGADIYVTLEPCAHDSELGPTCADILTRATPSRIIIGAMDPDPRTSGKGAERLRKAGIEVVDSVMEQECQTAMAGFFSRILKSRPFVTLKLATSLDGAIAMADGTSKWITGQAARAHGHMERARSDAILVGTGTLRADNPALTTRLPGMEGRNPRRILLGSGNAPDGWEIIRKPEDIAQLNCNKLLIEGGAQTASSFLKAGLVDRIILYRAPILIGNGKPCLTDIGLHKLADAHGVWQLQDTRLLGAKPLVGDRVEAYARIIKSGQAE